MQKMSTNSNHQEDKWPDFPKGKDFYEFLRRYIYQDSHNSEAVLDFVHRVHDRLDKAQEEHGEWGEWVSYLQEMMERTLDDLASADPQAGCREMILQNPEGLALAALTKYREFLSPKRSSEGVTSEVILRAAEENKAEKPIDFLEWPLAIQVDLFYLRCCTPAYGRGFLGSPYNLARLKERLESVGVDTDLLARIAGAFGIIDYVEGHALLEIVGRKERVSRAAVRAA